jgi:TM2 domain-containing membrane protein YozV
MFCAMHDKTNLPTDTRQTAASKIRNGDRARRSNDSASRFQPRPVILVGMTSPTFPYPPDNPTGQPGQPPTYPPAPVPPPGWPQHVDAYGRPLSDKSKLTAGLLGIFLGSFGVGRFYLGYTGLGIAQIAATWLTCGLGGIWPLIDAVMILVGRVPDAQGRTLRE